MVTSFKRSHACTAKLTAPSPAAGLHRPTPLLETPGHTWASLGQFLVGIPETETELCLSPVEVRISSGLLQGQGLWVQ